MVDTERVDRLLDRLVADTHRLRALADRRDLADDEVTLAAAKYQVVVVVEGASGIAQHLVVAEGWPVADSNADAFRRLATEGVLPADLAGRLARAVGFRNLLVRRYDDVDDARVVENLSGASDFEAFARSVARWLGAPR